MRELHSPVSDLPALLAASRFFRVRLILLLIRTRTRESRATQGVLVASHLRSSRNPAVSQGAGKKLKGFNISKLFSFSAQGKKNPSSALINPSITLIIVITVPAALIAPLGLLITNPYLQSLKTQAHFHLELKFGFHGRAGTQAPEVLLRRQRAQRPGRPSAPRTVLACPSGQPVAPHRGLRLDLGLAGTGPGLAKG